MASDDEADLDKEFAEAMENWRKRVENPSPRPISVNKVGELNLEASSGGDGSSME